MSLLTPENFERKLTEAMRLDVSYTVRPPRPAGAQSAVLALFGRGEQGVSLLLTRRTEKVETHKGQMAFPGGKAEPEEVASQRFVETALRETEEEVGISRDEVRVVGELPGLITVTGFWIRPFVGFLSRPISEVSIRPEPGEIDQAIWIPIDTLADPRTYEQEFYQIGGVRYPMHAYIVGEYRIWGATGLMVRNLLDRLQALG